MFTRRTTTSLALLVAPLLAVSACSLGKGGSTNKSGFTSVTPGTLTIATEVGNPGWVDGKDASHVTGGVEAEMARAFGSALGLKVKFVNVSFTPLVSGAVSNYDIGLMSIFRTPKRQKVNQYSDCYYQQPTGVLSTLSTPLTTLAAAKSARWGVEIGSYGDEVISALKPTQAVLKFNDEPSEYQALLSGRINAVADDFTSMIRRADEAPLQALHGRVDATIQMGNAGTSCVAAQFPKNAPSKNVTLLNAEIAKLEASGKLAKWINDSFPGATKSYPAIKVQ
ncbi:transporter substrate-binding domain-containing protein [Streptomyces arenae]|uniref:transporter substrate-binding domain-containing protein n=1 Tax=Streptomyces arenae TaxID=29301 RepID=UPI002658D5B0|nr:transporter substrate-binding domain-containing protein [Streptomyces arenae]